MNAILIWTVRVLICIVALKALIGFHFPWERCECCGKKYRDHVRFNGRLYRKCEN